MSELNIGMILNAAQACHGIDQEGGVTQNPFGQLVGFIDNPVEFTAGADKIDACYVGETAENVIVAFRGTTIDYEEEPVKTILDWLNNFLAKPVSVEGIPGLLHDGFSSSVERLWQKGFYTEIQNRMKIGKKLIVTGYSKGAALAPISATFLVEKLEMNPNQMEVCYFEPPRPGDSAFKEYFDKTFPKALRYEYQDDLVPHVPPIKAISQELAKIPVIGELLEKYEDIDDWNYKSVGNLRFVNWDNEIVGDSLKVETERVLHIIKLLEDKDLKRMVQDHMPCGHIYNVIVGTDCPS